MLNWRRENKGEDVGRVRPQTPGQAPSGKGDRDRSDAARTPEKTPSADPARVRSPRSRLGEILVEERAITPAQLEEALARKAVEGGFLGQALVDLGYLEQDTLISFLVKQCKIPHLNLLDYEIHESVLELISQETCLKYQLIPIDKLGRILTVAMVDPLDIEALEQIRAACPNLQIKPILCTWEHYHAVAQRLLLPGGGEAELSAGSLGLPDASARVTQRHRGDAKARPSNDTAVDAAVRTLAGAAKSKRADGISASEADQGSPGTGTVQPTPHGQEPLGLSGKADKTGPSVSLDEVAALVRDGTREAIGDAVGGLIKEFRDGLTAKGREPTGPSAEELASAVHDAVASATREAMGVVTQEIRNRNELALASVPDMEELGKTVAESVRAAVREAVEPFSNKVSPPEGQEKALAQEIHKAAVVQGAETTETLQAVREAVAALQEALQAAQSKQQPGLDAEDDDEATSSAGGSKSRQSAWQSARALAERYASIKVLRKPEQDALEALEGPGLRARADERIRIALESERPLAGYRFDNFFAGQVNFFTEKLCKAAAASPGEEYNPLFLYGDVGTGKTHLINAIGNAIGNENPDSRVGYVSASRFASRLLEAQASHAMAAFRANYCQWDVLILDDVQFLADRPEAQEEFFHIFNALYEESRQLVIAGDRTPDQSAHLDKRLASRFGGGIVTSLQPPEWETRVQILRHHAEDIGATVPEEILSLVANRVPRDVRKMSGSFRKVIAFARLIGQDITCDLAKEILSHLGVTEAA